MRVEGGMWLRKKERRRVAAASGVCADQTRQSTDGDSLWLHPRTSTRATIQLLQRGEAHSESWNKQDRRRTRRRQVTRRVWCRGAARTQ